MDQIEAIVREVLSRLQSDNHTCSDRLIPAEMSARHVHLSKEDLKLLFGLDQLECVREISQPGQFLSGCRLRLIGPKGIIDNVAVLGPTRDATQVEISATDARTLGISAPVRLSGELQDAAPICLQSGNNIISRKAAIIAKRHIHMTPADASSFGIHNGQNVNVRILGSRPLILEDVPVRITDRSALALHMDTDEANAAGAGKDCKCQILCVSSIENACVPYSTPANIGQSDPLPQTLQGKLITERDIRQVCASGCKSICISKGQIITPLAKDTAKSCGITLTYGG